MALLQRPPNQVPGSHRLTPTEIDSPPAPGRPASSRTRTGATWFGICVAAATLVVLIIFMLQNTRSVGISFLWLHGSVPLALGLLIAAVGSAVVVTVIGTARMTQLRRRTRRQQATVRRVDGSATGSSVTDGS